MSALSFFPSGESILRQGQAPPAPETFWPPFMPRAVETNHAMNFMLRIRDEDVEKETAKLKAFSCLPVHILKKIITPFIFGNCEVNIPLQRVPYEQSSLKDLVVSLSGWQRNTAISDQTQMETAMV